MRLLHKKAKKTSQYQELIDNYQPAVLPSYGFGLETFTTSDYSLNKTETSEKLFADVKSRLSSVLDTSDKHSAGTEGYTFIQSQLAHLKAVHEGEVANHKNQISRIQAARDMRKQNLELQAQQLQDTIKRLKEEIAPLEGLRTQFHLQIFRRRISIGTIITIAAMIVDALVNYSFLQSVLLGHFLLLGITVVCMSVMSDASMWALGNYISRKKEKFVSKPMFYSICISLSLMFLLSVVASVMIRYGSMNVTYGTVNADGEFVGKTSFSLAEYGVSTITAFVTSATGLLSFAFSLDENSMSVAIREEKKQELARIEFELAPVLNELALLMEAEDPAIRDEGRRLAAEHQLEALTNSLLKHYSMLVIEHVKDNDFTEKVCECLSENANNDEMNSEQSTTEVTKLPFPTTTISLTSHS